MPTGQKNRLFDKKLYNSLLNFRKFTDLEAGIKKTVDWYCKNKQN
jgi:nucleoside-diphosphate-sugar epimerase